MRWVHGGHGLFSDHLWIQSILYRTQCPMTMINDLTGIWEDFHEHSEIEAIDSTWWLGWNGKKGRISEKYSKNVDTQAESKVDIVCQSPCHPECA